jgi:hypothetical protein
MLDASISWRDELSRELDDISAGAFENRLIPDLAAIHSAATRKRIGPSIRLCCRWRRIMRRCRRGCDECEKNSCWLAHDRHLDGELRQLRFRSFPSLEFEPL